MADNIVVAPFTGSGGITVAMDEFTDLILGLVKAQYIKVMDGTADSGNRLIVNSSGQALTRDDTVAAAITTKGTGGITAYTAGTSDAVALAAGTRNSVLSIQNVSQTASIAIGIGTAAALNTAGSFQLGPGQIIEFEKYIPQDAIHIIASGAGTPVTILAA